MNTNYKESNKNLVKLYKQTKANFIKNELFNNNIGLVAHTSKKYINENWEYDDIFQIGCIGLMKAIEQYKEGYNTEFSTYAIQKIISEIRTQMRAANYITIGKEIKDQLKKMSYHKNKLTAELNREPNDGELSKSMGISILEFQDLNKISNNTNLRYLNSVLYRSKEGEDICLQDALEDNKDYDEKIANKLSLKKSLDILSKHERMVIELKYYRDMKSSEIARLTGKQLSNISRYERTALEKLRKYLM